MMLLVADDHADTREILVRLLKRDGYEASAVATGIEAIEFLRANKPLLVILDHSMPGMDGLEVLALMKKNPATANVPVIMYSAIEGALREQALEAGAAAFVLKASLDWSLLRAEIMRLAGPGQKPATTGQEQAPAKRQKRSG